MIGKVSLAYPQYEVTTTSRTFYTLRASHQGRGGKPACRAAAKMFPKWMMALNQRFRTSHPDGYRCWERCSQREVRSLDERKPPPVFVPTPPSSHLRRSNSTANPSDSTLSDDRASRPRPRRLPEDENGGDTVYHYVMKVCVLATFWPICRPLLRRTCFVSVETRTEVQPRKCTSHRALSPGMRGLSPWERYFIQYGEEGTELILFERDSEFLLPHPTFE